MRLIKALLAILLIPAFIYIFDVFGNYADGNMVLNSFEELIMGSWQWVFILLVGLGVIMALKKMFGGRGD